jgi:hypothetical protein
MSLYRDVVLGTSYEGAIKIHWTDSSQRYLKLMSKSAGNGIVKTLKGHSDKLFELGEAIPMLQRTRNEAKEGGAGKLQNPSYIKNTPRKP